MNCGFCSAPIDFNSPQILVAENLGHVTTCQSCFEKESGGAQFEQACFAAENACA